MLSSAENKGIALSIETAIAGGSISLIRDSELVAGTTGGESVSRAEDLLLSIDDLLKASCVERTELSSITVSTGPGSFTGLRIGLATAMGLSTALGIPCKGVPLFDAIAKGSESSLVIVVPLGKADLCFRYYENGKAKGDFVVGDITTVESVLQETAPERIAHHPDVDVSQFVETGSSTSALVDLGPNLSEYIGKYAAANDVAGSLEPIYVRNPRFA